MAKSVRLPIVDPPFATYHTYASGGAVIKNNPSILNWYYNRASLLRCDRRFLGGYTSPGVYVSDVNMHHIPHLECREIPMEPLGENIHSVIRELLDNEYYVHFYDIDDYYMMGKSWYMERHFPHDGLICGYDENDSTYSIYAYDKSWLCRVFKCPVACFEEGRQASFENGIFGKLVAIKPKETQVALDCKAMCQNLKIYLNSSLEKFPPDLKSNPLKKQLVVTGLAVHDYICIYLDKLLDGSIPYERMDRRVFRLIWEHKRVMHDRFRIVEEALGLDNKLSESYAEVVKKADNARMLYASYHMKRRDPLLEHLKKILQSIKEEEKPLIHAFIKKVEECNI